jgi:replicative DNA helicase Mcm
MFLLFGGVPKILPDITIRGEMNALLIGDPGTAKSKLLQYVARIAPADFTLLDVAQLQQA